MTNPRLMKITIPAQTVIVNATDWAIAYGIELKDVRDDVKAYFAGRPQEHVDSMGLGK